jgi:hypothetical protein
MDYGKRKKNVEPMNCVHKTTSGMRRTLGRRIWGIVGTPEEESVGAWGG